MNTNNVNLHWGSIATVHIGRCPGERTREPRSLARLTLFGSRVRSPSPAASTMGETWPKGMGHLTRALTRRFRDGSAPMSDSPGRGCLISVSGVLLCRNITELMDEGLLQEVWRKGEMLCRV